MSRGEIGKKIFGDEFDNIKFCDNLGSQKRRKVDRYDKRIKNAKPPVERTKTVALRLRNKLIERGKTPNLDGIFFLKDLIGKSVSGYAPYN